MGLCHRSRRTPIPRVPERVLFSAAAELPWAGLDYYDAATARLGKWLRHFIPDCPEMDYWFCHPWLTSLLLVRDLPRSSNREAMPFW